MITTDQPRVKSKVPRTIVELVIATICSAAAAFTVELILLTVLSGPTLGMRDFVVYWATGQQEAHHLNPYDRDGLLQRERAAGLRPDMGVMFMRNPPTALPIVYPLGLLNLRAASLVWPLPLLIAFGFSVYLLRGMHGNPKNRRHLLAYSFGPALICLMNGQSTVFALLGLVLFLRFHRTQPYVAGMCLWLCSLKPHLFLPFGVAMIAWILLTRNLKLLAGIGVAMAANFAVMLSIDPRAWKQYLQMLHISGIDQDFIPCTSYFLRTWISPHTLWLQYLPAGLACAWALRYFWIRRNEWDWIKHGSLLLLVSILAAPYSWLYDQVLAIPALLHGSYVSKSRNLLALLALLSALTEIALFCNSVKPSAVYLWTVWTAPVWLVWYLAASASQTESQHHWPLNVKNWFRTASLTRATRDFPVHQPTD